VDTPEFIHVLKNFSGISSHEAQSVLTLKETYPFSQVLHVLAARVSKDHGFTTSPRELQLAAVYTADRAILKSIMERTAEPLILGSAPMSETLVFTKAVETGHVDYAEELILDMERLNELRNNFELLFVDGTATSFPAAPPVVEEKPPVEVTVEALEEAKATESTERNEPAKSKKERIIELAKSVIGENITSGETHIKGRRKRKDFIEAIMDEIVVGNEELSVESEKQKEQIELIDHFIKASPTITGTKDKLSISEDLSSVKPGDFNDNIISETLVEILLKQGKKDKAVEVLKKLIWKFPQKKAYFATQIEELKK
jgi:hypothetical protein